MTLSRTLLIGSIITAAISVLLTAIIIGLAGFFISKDEIERQTQNQLVALREEQKAFIDSYLDQIHHQVKTQANSQTVREAAKSFITSFYQSTNYNLNSTDTSALKRYYISQFGSRYKERNHTSDVAPEQLFDALSEKAKFLQHHFISANPNPLGEKDKLVTPNTNIDYREVHETYHPEFRNFLNAFGYYDIFIIDAKTGDIVYSVFKELDFASSLTTGPFASSGLANAFKKVRNGSSGDIGFSPFNPYTPSYEDPAAFIASPIVDNKGETIAVLAFQMPIDKINEIMTMQNSWVEKGLGETGETYLVSEDFKAQSLSRFLLEDPEAYIASLSQADLNKSDIEAIKRKGTNIGYQTIRTAAVEQALSGKSGYELIEDYRGVDVLSAYTPLMFEGSRFALLAEIDKAEAYSFQHRIIKSTIINVLIVSVVILSLAAFIAWRFSNALSKRLQQAVGIASSVARGEKVTIDSNQKSDEIGELMLAMNKMQIEVIGKFEEAAEESNRITSAVEAASTNIMMADADFNIIYMNPAVQNMMKLAEADLQTALPNFVAKDLIGKNIDVFHKNPAHQRSMLEKLTDTYRTEIKVGVRTFSLVATPIFNDARQRLGTVVEWMDRTDELNRLNVLAEQQKQIEKVAEETKRIKDALDACSTNVMLADNNYNIIYMNPSVQEMMKLAESDLKKSLPHFNANELIGKNIDVFHKNPAHQRAMLERLRDTYRTTIQIGERTFNLTATPIFNDHNDRIGTVVEWYDRTSEVKIENEISQLITAANDGDLTQRINPEGKTGFGKIVSDGLNSLMNTTATFVGDVGNLFGAMSEGDLTKTIHNDYKGELLNIKNNANNSLTKLTEVLSKIQSASDIVRTSSNEVAQGSDDLSRRTESQASSLEETAASMEEITATVKQTAESATQSNTLASEAKLKAEKGGDVVQGAVKAMSAIMESSKKISDIIGVIDEIAFQTNLLALNAAVEAARAGEQGRGFAVVAGEVRTLSQRSAAAAKEIKDLIRDSVNKVESGSHLVNQSGQMLAEIVKAVDQVAKMIADVNTAAIEQNSGISQINQAVAQMDEMTQQNAALVEQTSAASRSMSEEANNMSRLISFFQISRHGTVSTAPAYSHQEPIKTYKPVAAVTSKSQSSKTAANKGSSSAASFSNEDEWEDF
jgi:methyl-accepting chemotaxis protein